MSLHLLTGSTGTGKTYHLYKSIIDSAIQHPGKRHVVLVPEQFTMQTQRALVEMHPGHAILNIEVMSFDWLAHQILKDLSKPGVHILDDSGISMLLRKSAGEKKKELAFFRRNLTKAGFISRMKSMLAELLQYGITEEDLARLKNEVQDHPILAAKLADLQIFYHAFQENRDPDVIAAEELAPILLRELPHSDYLKDAVIGLDGYTGFTTIQYEILGVMLTQASTVGITLTIPASEDLWTSSEEQELFAMTRETANRLLRLADAGHIPCQVFVCEGEKETPQRPAEFAHLEQHFLRYGTGSRYMSECSHLHVLESRTPQEEVAATVHEILRLLQREGYRYREIAIITGDLERYRPLLAAALEREQIPYFMDQKKGILNHPLVIFLRSAMDVVEKNFAYEPVFRYLKTGMTTLNPEDIDILENYVLATGRKGYKTWQKTWDRTYRDHENVDLEEINRIREEVLTPLAAFREGLRSGPCTVRRATESLRNLMENCHTKELLQKKAEALEAAGDLAHAEEFARVMECVLALLDQADQLIGDEVLSIPELGDVLDAGWAEARLGMIPHVLDQIAIGDIERSRLTDIRVLFFLGMNEGVIPQPAKTGGIISDEEREVLKEHQLELAPTAREIGFREQFYLYRLLTKPTEQLILSYSKISADGQPMRPSWYISQILRVFPSLQVRSTLQERPVIDSWSSALDAMAATAGELREKEPEGWWKELYLLLSEEPEQRKKLSRILDACFYRYDGTRIQKAVSSILYGNSVSGSVTRLETYAACAYAQFITYGLRLTERVEYEFGSMDRGNFFHKALETVFQEMKKGNLRPEQVDDTIRKKLVDSAITQACALNGGTILQDSAQNAYFVERWRKMTDKTVWAICEQLKASDFRPEELEMLFDGSRSAVMNLILSEEERMYLRGVIDRVDLYEDDDRVYVKIVDYKTGRRALELGSVYYGLQLQLMVYLDAVMELEQRLHPDKEVVPAGVYYYQIQEPFVESTAALPEEELEKKLLNELKLKGLTNSGNHVPEHMESVGGISVTPEEFRVLQHHVRRKVREFGSGILSGEIPASPYRTEKQTACERCAFAAVCGFDPGLPGYRYRRLRSMDTETLWEKMREEEEEGEE